MGQCCLQFAGVAGSAMIGGVEKVALYLWAIPLELEKNSKIKQALLCVNDRSIAHILRLLRHL